MQPYWIIVNKERFCIWQGPYVNEAQAVKDFDALTTKHGPCGWELEQRWMKASKVDGEFNSI